MHLQVQSCALWPQVLQLTQKLVKLAFISVLTRGPNTFILGGTRENSKTSLFKGKQMKKLCSEKMKMCDELETLTNLFTKLLILDTVSVINSRLVLLFTDQKIYLLTSIKLCLLLLQCVSHLNWINHSCFSELGINKPNANTNEHDVACQSNYWNNYS